MTMLRTVKQEKRTPQSYSVPVYRVSLVKENSVVMDEAIYRSAGQLAPVLSRYYDGLDREYFVVVMLNGKNRIIGFNTVSIGSLSQAIVEPREVFKPAIACSAMAVILSHNHPSGDPTPSREDITITDKLKTAGDILGIKVLDHVVMGDYGKYFSFTDEEGRKKATRETSEINERLKWRIERAEKAAAKGSATGAEIVLLAENKIKHIYRGDPTIKEIITRLEETILTLTPVSERKRGPVDVRTTALLWIEVARNIVNKMRLQQQSNKTSHDPLRCPPGCVPGMKLKVTAHRKNEWSHRKSLAKTI
jgi:DNA repair protein RadC